MNSSAPNLDPSASTRITGTGRGEPWNPQFAITEADATLAAQNDTIKSLKIIKDGDDFYVLLSLSWRKEELFLATTRTQNGPRKFKHLGRLVEYIEEKYPTVETATLLLKPAKP